MALVEVGCYLRYEPAAGGNSAVATLSRDVTRAGRPIRVLVVDDDQRVRAALDRTIALEADLVMVGAAADTASALGLAQAHDPSVAVVDVLLPDAGAGLALVRRLAQRPGCAVVAISVRGGLRPAALAAGAVAFVEKDGDIDALLHAVRSAAL